MFNNTRIVLVQILDTSSKIKTTTEVYIYTYRRIFKLLLLINYVINKVRITSLYNVLTIWTVIFTLQNFFFFNLLINKINLVKKICFTYKTFVESFYHKNKIKINIIKNRKKILTEGNGEW